MLDFGMGPLEDSNKVNVCQSLSLDCVLTDRVVVMMHMWFPLGRRA